jgi:hypothetical protein
MPKATKRKQDSTWTSGDHEVRKLEASRKFARKGDAETMTKRERRAHLLSHDTKNRRDEQKLALHLTKINRELSDLRNRLERWDQESEDRKHKERVRKRTEDLAKLAEPKPRRTRKGPETWKLTGAARPAWEVYDFDVRYVDPHAKAHLDFSAAVKRQRNLLVLHKNQFGTKEAPPITREFLSLLMQQAMLALQGKKLKTARAALLECLALESTEAPITTARCHLIRMYLENNRPDSARRLIERYELDPNCWIRYSAALIEFVSWKLLGEQGSTRATAGAALTHAINANPYCALYLAFFSTFEKNMEYTDEVDDTAETDLEEAIEYANHEQGARAWMETDGSLEWLKKIVQKALQSKTLEWSSSLKALEDAYRAKQGDDNEKEENADEEVDVLMFAGMFRTAMEMLEESGELANQEPSDDESEEGGQSDEGEPKEAEGDQDEGDNVDEGDSDDDDDDSE